MKITMVLHILYDDITVIKRSQREQAAKKSWLLTEKVTYFQQIGAAVHLSRGWGQGG